MATFKGQKPSSLTLKEPGSIAQRIVVCGDPKRVRLLKSLLRNPHAIKPERGFIAYTGKYNSVPVTIMAHLIGGSSASCLVGDIAAFTSNPKVIIRIGSGEGNREGMEKGDLILPSFAFPNGGVIKSLGLGGYSIDTNMDSELINFISTEAQNHQEKNKFRVHEGNDLGVFSSDTFHIGMPTPSHASVVDMETAAITAMAHLGGMASATILIVNQNLAAEAGYKRASALPADMQRIAAEIALGAITKVPLERLTSRPNVIKEKIMAENWKPLG